MTLDESIQGLRLRVMRRAEQLGNVRQVCTEFGISRTLFYRWRRRFEQAAPRASAMFDERFIRSWRLYLASSQAAFAAGSLQLFQAVFARGCEDDVPWTRRHIYGEADSGRSEGIGPM